MPTQKIKKVLRSSSTSIMDMFDVGPAAAFTALAVVGMIVGAAVIFFIRSAPPSQITMSTGPEGGSFQRIAQKYAKILEADGVKLVILPSQGSSLNLQRLKDRAFDVDIALVQAGVTTPESNDHLISLGSVSQQPLLVFYRGKPLELLAELKGKRIAIGPEGSGANQLAKAVLALNGVKVEEGAKLEAMESDDAAKALTDKKIDAAFIMSESTAFSVLKGLMRSPDIRLYSFKQSSAYIRKLDYLAALNLPQGVMDIGINIPPNDISLIGPTVDLIARKTLHPAISDLLLEAATQVHSRPGLYQKRGEFPAPLEHGVRISDDANRYYKSGKSFLYSVLPYWLASLVSRVLVVFLPTLVILIPAVKMILSFFTWRVKVKIYQRYRELVSLEKQLETEKDPEKQAILKKNFDRIEEAVHKMRIKGSYADQIYGLRGHIDYVKRLTS